MNPMQNLSGYVIVAKSLASHNVWLMEKFSRGQAWVDLLLLCNDQDRDVAINGTVVQAKRGQVLWSMRSLAERWGWNTDKTTAFLRWLEARDMIRYAPNCNVSIITITNFDSYQSLSQEDQERTRSGHVQDADDAPKGPEGEEGIRKGETHTPVAVYPGLESMRSVLSEAPEKWTPDEIEDARASFVVSDWKWGDGVVDPNRWREAMQLRLRRNRELQKKPARPRGESIAYGPDDYVMPAAVVRVGSFKSLFAES